MRTHIYGLSLEHSLPGRTEPVSITGQHAVTGCCMLPPFGADLERSIFAMGCFWGAERRFWQQKGVEVTAVGYVGGYTPNPSYQEVCSGLTGHTEAVLVVYDPVQVVFDQLLKVFWESHDPTQGMRQGNDVGTQYRSGIYCSTPTQLEQALAARGRLQPQLSAKGYPEISSEIVMAPEFYYAESYHQQYLAKTPGGYCGLQGVGITYA